MTARTYLNNNHGSKNKISNFSTEETNIGVFKPHNITRKNQSLYLYPVRRQIRSDQNKKEASSLYKNIHQQLVL